MRLDFNYPILDLDGKEIIEDGTAVVAKNLIPNIALLQKKEDPIKSYELALKIHKEGFVEVDTSDYEYVYNAIKDAQGLHTLVKAQALKRMKADKEKVNG